MTDATLAQGHTLTERILREEDPRVFLQNLLANWGSVQTIGRGEVTQAQLIEALKHLETNAPSAQAPKAQQLIVQEQVKLLLEHLPHLDVSHVEENIALATGWMNPEATGLFCYVRTETMAIHFGIQEPWDNFGVLTEKTLGLLGRSRKFHNYREGQLDSKHHRLLASTKAAMQKIEAQQKGDIIVILVQLGELYRGKSVDASRVLIGKSGNQFCLPAFIVGQIFLVNPDILTSNKDLFIDCPGDEYHLDTQELFDYALYFGVDEVGILYFDDGRTRNPYAAYGSAWGFFQ